MCVRSTSSMKMIDGDLSMAMASDSRFFCPPEIPLMKTFPTRVSAHSFNPARTERCSFSVDVQAEDEEITEEDEDEDDMKHQMQLQVKR